MSEHIAHVRKADGVIQLLPDHLRGVARLSREFANKIGLPQQGELIGLLHDLGKYSMEFQNYLKSAVELLNPDEDEFVDAKGLKGKVDHSTAGAQLIWQELAKFGQLGQIVAQILALCIASHHSGLIDCLSADENSLGDDSFSKRMNKLDERSHLNEALAAVDDLVRLRAHALMAEHSMIHAIKSLVGKIILNSPEKNDRSVVVQQHLGLLVRFLFSCLIDADRIDTADFENPRQAKLRMKGCYADWDTLCFRLEAHLADFMPRYPIDQLRQDISRHCFNAAKRSRGIFTLTVPTGGGKTLASLRFALQHAKIHQMERVIYVIPFTSIIDQNADVVRRILEPQGVVPGTVVLEHHSNLTPEAQTWRSKMLSENWDAPVVYTTSVQFLETMFGAGTRGARRMHQLANAVLIFDEIQTLPVNCVHLFNNAISFLTNHCGSTVVLCTATQPLLDKVDTSKGAMQLADDHEIMPNVQDLFEGLKRVEVNNQLRNGGWPIEEIAALALREVARAQSCLVIVNTKIAAQAIYRQCKQRAEIKVYHLSTNMCPAHRKVILSQVRDNLEAQTPTLCISTQLIEAGVDVDFGCVIRFTAGLDSIAQAAGRCNRNGRQDRGIVHVINPQDENLNMLPDIRIGRDRAERVLSDFDENPDKFGNNLIGPQALAWYYQNYFYARADEMAYPVSETNLGHRDSLLNLLSCNTIALAEHSKVSGKAPDIYLRQSFMAAARAFKAIDAPTRGVLVPYEQAGRDLIADLCSAYMPDKEFDLLRKAQQYSVNVFPNVLEKLQKAGVVREVRPDTDILFLIDSRYYSAEFGLATTPEGNMEVLYG